MKRLPNADAAIVDETKVTGYLLSTTHPYGRTKAEFFREFGFVAEDWQALRQALREHALSHPVESVKETPFGRKYIVNGPLATPGGRKPRIRTVWFIEQGEQTPRLVTAYPIGGDQHDS